ncbi:MAG: chemotaxis protein CheA [Campylobacterota bacterium]|nr:chemotaxis protein CheA [Campylobacterota bacterium]
MSDSLKEFFSEEAAEIFASVESILMSAEENGSFSDDDINALFRDMHTLKGSSNAVGFEYFSKFVHHLETFMENIRNGIQDVNKKVIEFIIDSSDKMQVIFYDEFKNELNIKEFEVDLQTLLKDIENLKNPENPVDLDLPKKEDIKKDSKESSKSRNKKEKVKPKEKIKVNNQFVGEFVDLVHNINDCLELGNKLDEYDEEFLREIFRFVHTLKGSSLFMGLEKFSNYLHSIETLLDMARDKDIVYTKEINKYLIEVINVSQQIADDEINNDLDLSVYDEKLNELEENIKNIILDSKLNKGYELFQDKSVIDSNNDCFVFFDENNSSVIDSKLVEVPVKAKEKVQTIEPKVQEEKIQKIIEEKPEQQVKKQTIRKMAASSSIRVGLDKIDFLMNRVGDLVITKSMLFEYSRELSAQINNRGLVERLEVIDREIRELQEAVMSVRMTPMDSVYQKFPKVIRDLSKKLNKQVNFIYDGETVEIDKLMMEGLIDPLTHIIRNSMDHGIETSQERVKRGKDPIGTLKITTIQESGHIIMSITDDGAGINVNKVCQKALENGVVSEDEALLMDDNEKAMLIFRAGLSTADEVSDISGRGVGMDVVENNINSLGGYIKLQTRRNKGTTFKIILPLTLAILDGLNVEIGSQIFIMPLNMILESLQPTKDNIKNIGDNEKEILMLRDEFIPIIRLHEFFSLEPRYKKIEDAMLIVTQIDMNKVALLVDNFLEQEQIVVKSLDKNYRKIDGVSAATIRGNGSIGLILDIMNIVDIKMEQSWS